MNFRLSFMLLTLALASARPARADHPTLSLEDGSPGPVTTISAIPLPAGKVSAGVQSQFIFTDEISDADLLRYTLLDEHVHSTESLTSLSLNSAYGVTDDLTAGFALPYIWRSGFRNVGFAPAPGSGGAPASPLKTARHGGHAHAGGPNQPTLVPYLQSTDFEGLGDATFYGQYRFFHDKSALRHGALLFGLKTPTGRTDVRDARGALIEGDHQPGSGSWDPLAGLSFTRQAGDWSFDINGLYTFVTEGTQKTNRGDIVNYNVALSYRVLGGRLSGSDACDHEASSHLHSPKESVAPHEHHHDVTPLTWDLILEANGDWRDRVSIDGLAQGNTGGNVIFLSAGTRVTLPGGWASSLSVGLPAVNDLRGIQSEPALRMLIGISRGF